MPTGYMYFPSVLITHGLVHLQSSLVYDRTATQDEEIQTAAKKQTSKPLPQKHAKSQKTLLAGVIKKKRLALKNQAE